MRNIGAKHLKTTPRWPQANGEVERQNQSLLKTMKISQAEGKDWQEEILSYLAAYRASPHPSTGYSSAELLFGCKIRTKLPQLNTEMVDNESHDQDIRDRDAEKKGCLSKLYADEKRNARPSDVMPGDSVLLRREQTGKLDTPFIPEPYHVIEKSGNKVTVQSQSGARYYRNSSRVKKFVPREEKWEDEAEELMESGEMAPESQAKQSAQKPPSPTSDMMMTPTTPNPQMTAAAETPTLRRSAREKHLPKKFDDYVMTAKT
jgi:hypothetical protein